MSTGNTPRDDAEFEAFLGRESPLAADYAGLEKAGPPASLDEKILAVAKVAARPAPKPVPKTEAKPVVTPIAGKAVPTQPAQAAGAPAQGSGAERRKRPRPEATPADDHTQAVPARRPPWLLPAALAASVLVAVGVGLGVYLNAPSDSADATLDGSLFAKRARERSEESKAATAAVQDAEVIELELAPLPPPPVFQPEGPQVQDLDAAIALIRKELVLANQMAAAQADQALELQSLSRAPMPGQQSAAPAPTPATEVELASPASASVVQPRERRLTKILELYDGGNPDLAGDSLEIFLRDFEDDPISKRIVALTPE